MALIAVDLGTGSGSTKPYIEEYAKNNPKDKTQHLVTKIFLPKSGKGAIVETDSFNLFVWKKSPPYNFFLEQVASGLKEPGFPLIIQIMAKEPYYSVAYDDSRTAFFTQPREGVWEQIAELAT